MLHSDPIDIMKYYETIGLFKSADQIAYFEWLVWTLQQDDYAGLKTCNYYFKLNKEISSTQQETRIELNRIFLLRFRTMELITSIPKYKSFIFDKSPTFLFDNSLFLPCPNVLISKCSYIQNISS